MEQLVMEAASKFVTNGIIDICNQIRPKIDVCLKIFNLSPEHIIFAPLKTDKVENGRSIRFNIGGSVLSGGADAAQSTARGQVLLRMKHQSKGDYLEFSVDRKRFYEVLGSCKTEGAASGFLRIDIDDNSDRDAIGEAVCADLRDRLLNFPSDFGCCSRYAECSNADRCINEDQCLAVSCGYKKNLMQGKVFYGDRANGIKAGADLPAEYVVLDLETTGVDPNTARIIEFSACKVKDGEITEWLDSLVNPQCHIPWGASNANHIYDKDVADAPSFCEISDKVRSFIGNLPLVGHNIATYDIRVLEQHLHRPLFNQVFDTLTLSRKHLPGLPSYKLDYLNGLFACNIGDSHRTHNDVLTTKRLADILAHPLRYRVIWGSFVIKDIAKENNKRGFQFHNHGKIPEPTVEPNPNSELYGKSIVFTGDFSFSRQEGMQLAVNAGMVVKTGVSKKVDYLVCGEQDPRVVGDDYLSTKQEKAIALNEQGANIKFLSGGEFLAMIGNVSISVSKLDTER